MKIALVDQPIGYISPSKTTGSINNIVYEIARRVARSAEVVVYGKRGPGQTEEEVIDGVRFKRLDSRWDDRVDRRLSGLFRVRKASSPWFLSHLYYRSYIRRIADDVSRQKYDIVHLYNFSQFATAIRARDRSPKILLNMQCEWLIQLNRKTIERHLRSVDRVIGCSDFITGGVRRHFPYLANRCTTVPNGADAEKFATIEKADMQLEPKTILYTGRISPEKGVHVLIDAFTLVAEEDPSVQLHLIGPEAIAPPSFICDLVEDPVVRNLAPLCVRYLDRLRQRIPEHLRKRVKFLGAMAQSGMREHYARAWVATHPSVCNEAFGMPVVEAMMSGSPVVVSAVGGMPEIVLNGKTGLVVQRNDSRALANALLAVLHDRTLRDRMGYAGKERALELYTWDRVADTMLREYHDALRDSVPSAPSLTQAETRVF